MKGAIELLLSFSSFIIHHFLLLTPWPRRQKLAVDFGQSDDLTF
jgi:hypothetical protein